KWIFHWPYQPEKADILMNELRSLVLTHWQNYHPTMLAELEKENRLEETLKVTEEQIIDLMYELEVVNKMDRTAAWEIVLDQFFLPEEESSSANQSLNQNDDPAISE